VAMEMGVVGAVLGGHGDAVVWGVAASCGCYVVVVVLCVFPRRWLAVATLYRRCRCP
jgi:hypothetical protein